MANQLIKYSYSTGELSEQFFGRTDIEQYDLGLARAQNWFVDYRGGLSNRSGLRFHEYVQHAVDEDHKLIPFVFSDDPEDKYVLVLGSDGEGAAQIRFTQNGQYILRLAGVVESITGAVITVADPTGIGWEVGDWVYFSGVNGLTQINQQMFEITAIGESTITIAFYPSLDAFSPDSTFQDSPESKIYWVYRIDAPWASEDFRELRAYHKRDLIRFTHPDYPIYNLRRQSHTNWVLNKETIGFDKNPPTGLNADPSGAGGDASICYTVTATFRNGAETRAQTPKVRYGTFNYAVEEGSVDFSCNPKTGAEFYNWYRSAVTYDPDHKMTNGMPLGFIGSTRGTHLIDGNIVPDYTRSPPISNDPFEPGAITYISVTSPGGGHDDTTTVSITDPDGTGFEGYPIVSAGDVVGVVIQNGGSGYTDPTVVFGGAGSGASANATARELTGTYPGVSTIFQQRQLYAGSLNFPLTIWASKVRDYDNFDYSEITIDSDSYEFEIDASALNRIMHMEPQRGGLLIMTKTGIWQLTGGQEQGVTPSNALADPQTYTGVSSLRPIKVENNLLYVEGKGYGVRMLAYNEFSKVYSSDDKSLLSRHLFGVGKEIIDWAPSTNPMRLVTCIREDGVMLGFTIVAEEKVFAWTPWTTKGLFQHCAAIDESYDHVYTTVKRYLNGHWVVTLEGFADRTVVDPEEAFFVDCGLSLTPTYPAATLTITSPTRVVSSYITSAHEGGIIRAGGGKYVIEQVVGVTVVVREIIAAPPTLPEDADAPTVFASGEWTLDMPTSLIEGLWHLEGMDVVALADGSVVKDLTVTAGKILLPTPATRVNVGLSYKAVAQTLPPVVTDTIIESRRKRIVGTVMRMFETRGVEAGNSLDRLYPIKTRTTEPYNQHTALFTGLKPVSIEPQWDLNSQTYFVQDQPLPATLLGHVVELEVGDDKQ